MNDKSPSSVPETKPSDSGILEIYDPENDSVKRVELEDLILGEVRTLGSDQSCDIVLDHARDFEWLAELIMSPRGPIIKSRGTPLWFDGRKVNQHLLYDGDHLYMGRIVFYYHNFFRQRGLEDLSIERGNDEIT